MTFFADAAGMAYEVIRGLNGTDATYNRGESDLALRLVRAQSEPSANVDETEEQWIACDWLVLAKDLSLDNAPFLPEPGDLIFAGGESWEVLPDEAQCYRFEDPGRSVLRVLTKLATV